MTSVLVAVIGNMIIVRMDLAVLDRIALVYNLKQHSYNMAQIHNIFPCICKLTNITKCY